MSDRKHILFDENTEGPVWVATFYLGGSEVDDDMESTDTTEISFNAYDFDTAARYAQQYLRKMQVEDDTSEEWSTAEILSVELRG